MRILAIDHGDARAGCAISDPSGTIVAPARGRRAARPRGGRRARRRARGGADRGRPAGLARRQRGRAGRGGTALRRRARRSWSSAGRDLRRAADDADGRGETRAAGAARRRDALAAAHLLESYLRSRGERRRRTRATRGPRRDDGEGRPIRRRRRPRARARRARARGAPPRAPPAALGRQGRRAEQRRGGTAPATPRAAEPRREPSRAAPAPPRPVERRSPSRPAVRDARRTGRSARARRGSIGLGAGRLRSPLAGASSVVRGEGDQEPASVDDERPPPPAPAKPLKDEELTIPEGLDRHRSPSVAKEAGLKGDYEQAKQRLQGLRLGEVRRRRRAEPRGLPLPRHLRAAEEGDRQGPGRRQLERSRPTSPRSTSPTRSRRT